MFLFEEGLSIFGIRLYAICILIGIIIAVIMGVREGKKLGIYSDFVYYGVIITVPLAIIGARLWYILFNLSDDWSFGKIIGLEGGMSGLAIQGGVIAAIVTVYFYCRAKKMPLYKVLDIVAPGFLVGQICGRWGNFFNKELYGPIVQNTGIFEKILPSFITDNMYIGGYYRHPTFLYEGALNLVGLIIMLVLRKKSKKLQSGDLMGIYLIWYGIVRIFTESLRAKSGVDEVLMIGNIKVSILISVLFIIGGGLFLVLKRKFGPKNNYQEIIKKVEENKIDTVLFDLDGTLLDSQPLLNLSFQHTFKKFFPEYVISEEDYNSFNGPTLHETFSRFTTDEDKIQEMIACYREFNMANHTKDLIAPFHGAKDVLKALHSSGYKIGIVSSKGIDAIKLGLDLYDLTKYFDTIVSADDIKKPKPDPEGINIALERLAPTKNVLYIGDNVSDMQAGINAGVKTCSVMYSNSFEECEKLNPTFCIKDLNGLYRILDE